MKNKNHIWILAVLLAGAFLAGCNIVSNINVSSGGKEYFPNTNGYSWTYISSGFSHTRTWDGSQSFSGLTLQKMKIVNGGTSEVLYLVTDSGVTFYGYSMAPTPDSWAILSFPLTTGKKWTRVYNSDYRGSSEVIGTETVTVPAGTFTCIKVKTNFAMLLFGMNKEIYDWYAPNVGLVKTMDITATTSGGPAITTTEMTSKNF